MSEKCIHLYNKIQIFGHPVYLYECLDCKKKLRSDTLEWELPQGVSTEEIPGEEDGPWAEGFAERCGNAAICDHTRFVFQHSLLSDYFVCMSCGYVKKKKGGEWAPVSSVESLLDTRSVDALPGGSTPSQYALPETAKELQDLIEFREMNFAMGNIFKACYRKKDSVDRLYDIRKIIWFAQREEQRLLREEACKKQ